MCRVNSVKRLLTLFTSTYPTRFSHPTALFGSLASRQHDGGSVSRKILSPELSRNVVRLTCESTAKGGVCDVYLIGTVHCYPKSLQDVKAVMNFLRPQVIFLELCHSRAGDLFSFDDPFPFKFSSKPKVSEFQLVFEETNKYGAKVILGDRPLEITMRRYEDKFFRMPFWRKMQRRFSIPHEPKKNLDDDYMYKMPLTRLNEFQYDSLFTEIFLDERDQYMSAGLLEVARKHNLVVAVVGKNHLLGIQKYWKQPVEVAQLLSMPSQCRYRVVMGVRLIILFTCATLLYFLITVHSKKKSSSPMKRE